MWVANLFLYYPKTYASNIIMVPDNDDICFVLVRTKTVHKVFFPCSCPPSTLKRSTLSIGLHPLPMIDDPCFQWRALVIRHW